MKLFPACAHVQLGSFLAPGHFNFLRSNTMATLSTLTGALRAPTTRWSYSWWCSMLSQSPGICSPTFASPSTSTFRQCLLHHQNRFSAWPRRKVEAFDSRTIRSRSQAEAASGREVSVEHPSIDDEGSVTEKLTSLKDLTELFHKADING